MINFWLEPYSEETIYGYICRIYAISGIKSTRPFFSTIFNCSKVRLHPYLACRLNTISETSAIDKDRLLYNHTLFNYFSFFQPDHSDSLRHAMLQDAPIAVTLASQQHRTGLKFIHGHYFCPICTFEDEKVPTYYLRHQIPGCSCCALHKCKLSYTPIDFYTNNHDLVLPESHSIILDQPSKGDMLFSSFSTEIFLACQKGLQSELNLHSFYMEQLGVKGLISPKGNMKLALIQKLLTEFWGAIDLRLVSARKDKVISFRFIEGMLRKGNKYSAHPLYNILVLGWLFDGDINNFLETYANSSKKVQEKSDWEAVNSIVTKEFDKTFSVDSNYLPEQYCTINCIAENNLFTSSIRKESRNVLARYYDIPEFFSDHFEYLYNALRVSKRQIALLQRVYTSGMHVLTIKTLIPHLTRLQIRHLLPRDYNRLYNHARLIFEIVMPTEKFQGNQKWQWGKIDDRCFELLTNMPHLTVKQNSISKLDMFLGGHNWLRRYARFLPKSIHYIQSVKQSEIQ